MMRAYSITLILCISILFVYSSQADSGTTKPKSCCYPEQLTGMCQVIVGSDIVSEYEYYADFKKMKALQIHIDKKLLIDIDEQEQYLFTQTGCTKMRMPPGVTQCPTKDAEFVSRFQDRALDGKGWRWIKFWKLYPNTSQDKADPSKDKIIYLYSDEKTCFTEKTVMVNPDGTSFTHLVRDTRPVVDDPTIFDLDISECVEVGDVTDTEKTEL